MVREFSVISVLEKELKRSTNTPSGRAFQHNCNFTKFQIHSFCGMAELSSYRSVDSVMCTSAGSGPAVAIESMLRWMEGECILYHMPITHNMQMSVKITASGYSGYF